VDTNGVADFDHADWADAKLACGSGGGNQPPVAQASANPTSGTAPLTVAFSSSGSSDPDGSISAYSWDLNGDGTFGDSTAANPSYQYTSAGTYSVKLRVTDNQGAQTTSSPVTITVTTGGGGSTTYVSDLTPTGTPVNGWGPWEKDRSNGEQAASDGGPLTLNGTTYAKGLGVHAASDLRFAIPAGCTTFTAQIGLDDEVGSNGNVIFRVLADGVTLFTSGALTGASATVPVSASVSGRAQLQLVVDTNGVADFDHADWADATLACS
jgi:PKD repeat protein